jgi:hypothetical protein
MNTKVNYTREFSANHKTAIFISASNHTLPRSQKTGESHCLILHLLGKIYALMESSSQGINCCHSNAPACPTTSMRQHPTLAQSTSNVDALDPSLPDFTPPTPIATRGWQVSVRRNPASNQKTHTSRLPSPTTVPFEHTGFPRLFLPCVCSPSRKMKCSTSFALNLASWSLATMRIASGLNPRSMHPSSVLTRCNYWSVLLSNGNAHSSKATTRTPFVKASSPTMRSLSYSLQSTTWIILSRRTVA